MIVVDSSVWISELRGLRTPAVVQLEAMAASGLPTKKATVEEGLRLLLRIDEQKKAWGEWRGMGWEGDLDAMREGRVFVPET